MIFPNMRRERRWGTIKTIDKDEDEGIASVTKRVKIVAGKEMPYHKHLKHTETLTVLSGMGKLTVEDVGGYYPMGLEPRLV